MQETGPEIESTACNVSLQRRKQMWLLSTVTKAQTENMTHLKICKGVGRLQGRNDALQLGQQLEGVQRLSIGDGIVLCSAGVFQPGVLRADAWIVQPASTWRPPCN